jgi:hypothetical protein
MENFEVIFEDARFRTYRATYERKARGMFAKLVKLERYDNNGKHWYWTLYRSACHGELEANTKALIKKNAELVRYQ